MRSPTRATLTKAMLAVALLLAISDPTPLLRAHAHNDYAHARPLEDALEQGFCSVEADVYLVDGELRVGHDAKDLVPGKTLEKLYLDPLLARVKARRGHVYEKAAPVTLLVDIKRDGEAVYAELAKRLPKYASMLTDYDLSSVPLARQADRELGVRQRAVTVILSGDRPIETLRRQEKRYAFIDARLNELGADRDQTKSLTPLVSDNYALMFRWNGEGEMSPQDELKLKMAVEKAHLAGARLRFWGTPDRPEVWKKLYDAGVDLINTDNLAGLADFLRKQGS